MSRKKIALLLLGWGLLVLPVLSKAAGFSVFGLEKQVLFWSCWFIGGPIVIYAKFKVR